MMRSIMMAINMIVGKIAASGQYLLAMTDAVWGTCKSYPII